MLIKITSVFCLYAGLRHQNEARWIYSGPVLLLQALGKVKRKFITLPPKNLLKTKRLM